MKAMVLREYEQPMVPEERPRARSGRFGGLAARACRRGVRDRPQAVPWQESPAEAAACSGPRICR